MTGGALARLRLTALSPSSYRLAGWLPALRGKAYRVVFKLFTIMEGMGVMEGMGDIKGEWRKEEKVTPNGEGRQVAKKRENV